MLNISFGSASTLSIFFARAVDNFIYSRKNASLNGLMTQLPTLMRYREPGKIGIESSPGYLLHLEALTELFVQSKFTPIVGEIQVAVRCQPLHCHMDQAPVVSLNIKTAGNFTRVRK